MPTVATPVCPCGEGVHTVEHLFTTCTDTRSPGLKAFDVHDTTTVAEGLSDTKAGMAALMARALLRSGWFHDFRVAKSLHEVDMLEAATAGWTCKPPPYRDKPRKARRRARQPGL